MQQPEWFPPTNGGARSPLKLYNSLTRSKNEFVPNEGNKVAWYICGPTVYDSGHMGHGRCYVTMDIMRRLLTDYFGYDVFYVMNITDIDDKIILRSRRKHLLKLWKARHGGDAAAVRAVVTAAAGDVAAANEAIKADTTDPKEQLALATHARVTEVLAQADAGADALLAVAEDMVMARLDKLWFEEDASVEDLFGSKVEDLAAHEVFSAHAYHFEQEFLDDMKGLNVQLPSVLTRVSEYVPEVVAFVQRIIDNGYAYEADGSVYFDVKAYAVKHPYGKLEPWSVGDLSLTAEGEGALSAAATGKKSPQDFALWKKSKRGEPVWPSPWGEGRPGWHIECSAMASDMTGAQLDIHSGGIDLCFPHHDNEIAQTEAHYEGKQWVNYFLHAGHVHIEGQKMSKSFKNFTTIRTVLDSYTSRQIRMMFLLHSWESPMDYTVDGMESAKVIEKLFNEFFLNVKASVRDARAKGRAHQEKWEAAERELHAVLLKAQAEVHEALADSLNYPKAMSILQSLVSSGNKYMKSGDVKNGYVLREIAVYITKMFTIFGLIDHAGEIGFPIEGGAGSKEDTLEPYLNALSSFRDEVRRLAREGAPAKDLLILSDKLRDDVLPELGVRLEDTGEGGSGLWKLEDATALRFEKEQRKLAEAERAAAKAAKAKERAEAKALKAAKAAVPPAELFKGTNAVNQEVFTQWDADGVPTHDADGEELKKATAKRVRKLFDAQTKAHAKWLASQDK